MNTKNKTIVGLVIATLVLSGVAIAVSAEGEGGVQPAAIMPGAITNDMIGETISVGHGGTGASTLTDHGVLVGSGTGAIIPLTAGADNAVLCGATGVDPSFRTLADADVPDDITIATGVVEHLLKYSDVEVEVAGSTYATPTAVLNTTTGSDHITITGGPKNLLITYSANGTITSTNQIIITNVSVLDSNGAPIAGKVATQTNITLADDTCSKITHTVQFFVEDVTDAENMNILVNAIKTAGTGYINNQTLSVIAL